MGEKLYIVVEGLELGGLGMIYVVEGLELGG